MRNKGIGTQLILQVIKQSKKDHIILQVLNNNLSTIKIYNKLGFTKYMEGNNIWRKKISIYIYIITK